MADDNRDESRLSDVKVGTHVVMRRFVSGKYVDFGVRIIGRLTPTQIILAPEGTFDKYHRCGGVHRFAGSPIGSATHQWIDRIANTEEIEQWEAKKRADDAERQKVADVRKAHEDAREALRDLFGNSAEVRGGSKGNWEVEFTDLTESQVRNLAAMVNGNDL